MKKRIPKKVREEAAMLCAVLASDRRAYTKWVAFDVHEAVGASPAAVDLADRAFICVSQPHLPDWLGRDASIAMEFYAEAEAMLRTGWCPDE